jgi:hypothetical protein
MRKYEEFSNDTLVYNSSSLSCKAIQPHLTSGSVTTGSLRPFRSGVMNLNQGLRRDCTLRRNRVRTSGRNLLRLAQRSTTSMQLTPRRSNFLSSLVTVYTKSPWDRNHFGCSMPRPRSFEEDIELAKRTHDPMMPLDDDRLSTTSFKITLVNHAQYISLGHDAQYDKMSELQRSPHLVHSGQLLSKYRKHLEHFECDQGNKDDDRAEHFHEAKLMEDLGQELSYDRPPNAAKDDVTVLDPVHNWPLRTRSMTHLDSYNYPPPVFADDEGGAISLADTKNDMPRNNEPGRRQIDPSTYDTAKQDPQALNERNA